MTCTKAVVYSARHSACAAVFEAKAAALATAAMAEAANN
jgi:hypothetical protein